MRFDAAAACCVFVASWRAAAGVAAVLQTPNPVHRNRTYFTPDRSLMTPLSGIDVGRRQLSPASGTASAPLAERRCAGTCAAVGMMRIATAARQARRLGLQ